MWKPDAILAGWLLGVSGGAALMVVTPGPPLWFRAVMLPIAVVTYLVGAPNLSDAAREKLREWWRIVRAILAVLLILSAGAVIGFTVHYRLTEVPREVRRAREEVARIEHAASQPSVRTMYLVDENGVRHDEVTMHGYEVLTTQPVVPSNRITTYFRGGARIAEDVRGSSGMIRRYYDGACNFASDFHDGAGNLRFLEFQRGCSGKKRVYSIKAPVVMPPVPFFTYL